MIAVLQNLMEGFTNPKGSRVVFIIRVGIAIIDLLMPILSLATLK
jgi:hypothetical protein